MPMLDPRRTRSTAANAARAGGPVKRTGSDLLASDVHHRLRSRILTLDLKPGTRLVEDELVEQLNVGRTPVREALLRLQGEGLVSRARGWVVEATDPSNFRSIFEARIAIEAYAARLAATRIDRDRLDSLAALLDTLDGDDLPRSEVHRLNRRFHIEIVQASGNDFFVEMHERTQFRHWNMRLPVVFMKDQLAASTAQHRAIFDALARHDGDAAEAATRAHIEATMNIVADALADD